MLVLSENSKPVDDERTRNRSVVAARGGTRLVAPPGGVDYSSTVPVSRRRCRRTRTTTSRSATRTDAASESSSRAFVDRINEHGVTRLFKGYPYKTIAVDDHDYWLTWGRDCGTIINRKPSSEAGWDDMTGWTPDAAGNAVARPNEPRQLIMAVVVPVLEMHETVRSNTRPAVVERRHARS